jgi:hypothetical protein
MGPNRVGVSCPHLKTETYIFQNVIFSSYLEFWTMDEIHITQGFWMLYTIVKTL